MTAAPFDPATVVRPHPRLMQYYTIIAALTLVAFPVTLFALWVKYRTLRYRFDSEGVWRRQGLLWRSEVNITYRRIQDIHLTNGLIQRWLGLATVSIQTAAAKIMRVIRRPMASPNSSPSTVKSMPINRPTSGPSWM